MNRRRFPVSNFGLMKMNLSKFCWIPTILALFMYVNYGTNEDTDYQTQASEWLGTGKGLAYLLAGTFFTRVYAAVMICVALSRITRILKTLQRKGLVNTSTQTLNLHTFFVILDVVVSIGIQLVNERIWFNYYVWHGSTGPPPSQKNIITTILSQRLYDFVNQLAMLAITHLINKYQYDVLANAPKRAVGNTAAPRQSPKAQTQREEVKTTDEGILKKLDSGLNESEDNGSVKLLDANDGDVYVDEEEMPIEKDAIDEKVDMDLGNLSMIDIADLDYTSKALGNLLLRSRRTYSTAL